MQPQNRVSGGGIAATIVVVTWWATAVAGGVRAAGVEPDPAPARRRVMVDHAVTPAGGAGCRHCGVSACRSHVGHLAACRDGLCAPHCPVRPTVYGFYRTQWRRWPGEGVVPVSNEQAATPVAPPEVQVPGPDEESPRAPADVEPPAEDDAEAPAAAERPDRQPPSEMPPADPTRENPDDAAPPANNPSGAAESSPVPPTPPGEPPIPPAGEDPVPGPLDRSAVPDGEGDVVTEVGAMRYPGQVGRSIATGAAPWRLGSAGSQRAVDSARGL